MFHNAPFSVSTKLSKLTVRPVSASALTQKLVSKLKAAMFAELQHAENACTIWQRLSSPAQSAQFVHQAAHHAHNATKPATTIQFNIAVAPVIRGASIQQLAPKSKVPNLLQLPDQLAAVAVKNVVSQVHAQHTNQHPA
jgi:hypothetical protein